MLLSKAENEANESLKGRKACLNYLRRLAKKLRTIPSKDDDVINEDEEEDQFRLNEPQYGGVIETDDEDIQTQIADHEYDNEVIN